MAGNGKPPQLINMSRLETYWSAAAEKIDDCYQSKGWSCWSLYGL